MIIWREPCWVEREWQSIRTCYKACFLYPPPPPAGQISNLAGWCFLTANMYRKISNALWCSLLDILTKIQVQTANSVTKLDTPTGVKMLNCKWLMANSQSTFGLQTDQSLDFHRCMLSQAIFHLPFQQPQLCWTPAAMGSFRNVAYRMCSCVVYRWHFLILVHI